MPTTVTSNSNYSGKVAGEIIGKMYQEADTLAKGLITVVQDVNYKYNLRKISVTGGRRPYACSFLPAGSVVLSEKVIEPIKFKDDFELCKEDFRNQWNDGDLGSSAWNDGSMSDIMDAVLAEKLSQEALAIDKMIWSGDNTTNTSEFNGLLTQFKADTGIIHVAGAVSTQANVVAELTKAVTAITPAMEDNDGIKVMVSRNIYNNYKLYLVSQGLVNGFGGNANANPLTFGDWDIVLAKGLPANTIVIAKRENLVLATGLTADFNFIKLIDSDETQLDGKIKGTMVYNGGVGYYYSDEIVWYTTEAEPV